MLCDDEDKTIYHISECCNLVQKNYRTGQDCMGVGEEICKEIFKKLKYEATIKLYVRNPESAKVNETHNTCRGSEMQTDHLILTSKQKIKLIKNDKKELVRSNILLFQ